MKLTYEINKHGVRLSVYQFAKLLTLLERKGYKLRSKNITAKEDK